MEHYNTLKGPRGPFSIQEAAVINRLLYRPETCGVSQDGGLSRCTRRECTAYRTRIQEAAGGEDCSGEIVSLLRQNKE